MIETPPEEPKRRPYFTSRAFAKMLYEAFLIIENACGPSTSPPWDFSDEQKYFQYLAKKFVLHPDCTPRKMHEWGVIYFVCNKYSYSKRKRATKKTPLMLAWEDLKPTDQLKFIVGHSLLKSIYDNNGTPPDRTERPEEPDPTE